jgi:apolipoprotein N-acyltransferase
MSRASSGAVARQLAARRPFASAVLAGVLSMLAISPGTPGWLAWIALVPFLLARAGAGRRRAVALAIVYTVVMGVGTVGSWLAPAAVKYFGLGVSRGFGFSLAALAVISAAHGLLLGLVLLTGPRAPHSPFAVLWYAALWAGWEEIRPFTFPYYPGAYLSLSQYETLPVIQVASLCGTAGVTFVLVSANAGLTSLLLGPPRTRQHMMAAGVAVAVTTAAVGGGAIRLARNPIGTPAGPRVSLVDIDAADATASTLERYLEASRGISAGDDLLLVWPESALTTDIEHDRTAFVRLSEFVAAANTPLLAGGPGSRLESRGHVARFNSAHLLYPGHGIRSYHKRHLVPFAERWPPRFGSPPPTVTSLDPGEELVVLSAGGVGFGVLICFEIGDARGARALARRGARFIVNPTNDAWFRGLGPHYPWAVLRAVETGVPILRSANAGVSAVIDRCGRPVESSRPAGAPAALTARVPPAEPTVYVVRIGDLFLAVCGAIVIAGTLGSLARRSSGGETRTTA